MKIAQGLKVTLHFALKLEDGQVVDSTFGGKAATLVIGDGNLPAGFEQFLLGMEAGQKESFCVTPEHAFGQVNPNNVQEMKRSTFSSDITLEEGMIVSFADAAKTELPGVIKTFDADKVVVDFNHPLAGKTLQFDVQIEKVEAN
ncbi:MAG: peptidylprolyl isomerase [Oceanospirillaceae bacterium]|nr:peptidylprolyl isomerase [Oceanospirillaceae bacterium]MCP5334564.1 peptidylprolyl isomerase [Oceanospirillaceae bacterium]MCP5351402.1 peptidylprolyl isomerase [Oceanospirillaceae bacterium]